MIAEGHEGRRDGSAGRQEGENVGLRLKRRHISLRLAAVQDVTGDTDEIWMAGAERREHGRWITIM